MRAWTRLRPAFIVVSAVTSFVFPNPEVSAAEWRPFGLQGIAVRSLAVAPGRLCAGTAGRGVYCLDQRSKPSGWQPLGPDGTTITGLWIDPQRPGLIFAADDPQSGAVYRSLDGGQTWQDLGANIPPALSGMDLVRGVPGSDTVYGAGGAVWKSEDLGETWR